MFIGSCNGILHAVDKRTGEAKWTYDAAALDGGKPEFHGRALVTGDRVVIASDDRRADGVGYVYAIDRSTLKLLWKHRAGAGVMTDVLAAGGNVYVVTLADDLLALDLSTGIMRWKFPSGAANDRFLPNSTPAIAGDRIHFGTLRGTLYALNARSGSVSWQRDLGARVSTSIAVVGDDLYLGAADGRVHKIDAATGATRTQLRLDGTPNFKLVPVGESLLVFVNERGSSTLKSLPLTLEAVGWTRGAPGPGWSSFAWPYVWRNWVAVGRNTGEFAALRLADGQPEWHGRVAGTIAGIGGDEASLYLGTTGGTLYRYALPGVTR